MIRGVRDGTDLDYEMQLAGMNAAMAPMVQTIFLPASTPVRPITATLVRQIAGHGRRCFSLCAGSGRAPHVGSRFARACGAGAESGGRVNGLARRILLSVLDRSRLKRLAVIGANADVIPMLLGNYNGTPSHPVTILQGIKEAAGSGNRGSSPRSGARFALRKGDSPAEHSAEFKAAVQLAQAADAIIYVGGIDSQLEGEEMQVDYARF